MDILDTNATQFRRKRGRPRKEPQPSNPQPEPQPSNPQEPQPSNPQQSPQESATSGIGSADTFETVAASIAPVIGDGATVAPGTPGGVVVANPADEKIGTLLSGLTPQNVEKYATAIFSAAARGFKMPELELADHEKGLLCPALQVIAERKLPEILKALADKYGETAPEYALLGTFVIAYASRVALAQATKEKEKKPKDGEKPWGKQTTAEREDTSRPAAAAKPWGHPERSTDGTTGVSTTRGYQALPDSSDNPAPENLI